MKKVKVLLLLLAMAAFTSPQVVKAQDPTHLNVAPYRWVDGMDPAKDWNGVNVTRFLICEPLVTLSEQLEVIPALAESYKIVNPTTYEFKIRDNVTFTNGKPLTAEAIKASLERSIKTNARGGHAKIKDMVAQGNILTITTTEPFSGFLNNLTDGMYTIVDVTDLKNVDTKPACTGAYYVTNHVSEERFELAANEKYWGGAPEIKSITAKNIAHDAKADAILAGDLDVAQGPTMTTVSRMEGNKEGAQILRRPGVREYDIVLNTRPGHTLADPVLRKAISYAINRDVVAKIIGNGYASPAYMPFPEPANYGHEHITPQAYNLAKAKELLKQGGYLDKNGDGILEGKDGKPLEFVLQAQSNIYGVALPEAIQHMLKTIGIKINIRSIENASYNPADHVDVDMDIDGAFPVNVGDGQKFLEAGFSTGGSDNYGGYSNPEFDALMAELKVTFDPKERMKIFIKAQQHIIDNDVNVWLYAPDDITLASKKVQGITMHPLNYYFITKDWKVVN